MPATIYARIRHRGRDLAGRVESGVFHALTDAYPAAIVETGETLPFEQAEKTLAPVAPGKLVAIGLNYRDHVAEFNRELPVDPVSFLLAPSAVVGPGDPVSFPPESSQISYEAELAAVIGKTAFRVPEDRALEHVFGYTCANDVTARDIQRRDGQWTRAKSFPTFKPLGPHIVAGIDASDLSIRMRLNGEERQRSRTSNFIFPLPRLISFLSSYMRLEPGDVVITGTPSGVGLMQRGDVMEVEVENIGVLRNPIA